MAKRAERKKGGAWKTVKRVLNVLGVLLILLLMALCAFLIYQRVTGQEPKLFGYRLFEVQSGSMEPYIMTHDTILTKEIKNPDDIRLDDVVVFKNPQIWIAVGKPELSDQYIVHRVKKIYKGDDGKTYIVTLGDNNHGSEDLPTEISAVEAKYVGKISGGFFRFLRSPFGIVAVVAVIVAIFMAWRLVYAIVENRKKKTSGASGPDGEKDPDGEENPGPSESDAEEVAGNDPRPDGDEENPGGGTTAGVSEKGKRKRLFGRSGKRKEKTGPERESAEDDGRADGGPAGGSESAKRPVVTENSDRAETP